MNLKLKERFDAERIEFAFPTPTLPLLPWESGNDRRGIRHNVPVCILKGFLVPDT